MQARNHRFDTGRLPISTAAVKVVSVGNLSVGGTGKTPMCIRLLRHLIDEGKHPALLSRGYGRRTHGFLHVNSASTAHEVGDEPLEVYHSFRGAVPVFVCEDRVVGARRLLATNADIDCIILDDAYQHRYLHRDINLLLTDYSRLYTRDRVLPEGRLREAAHGAARADIIVVTKCPENLTPQDAEAIISELKPTETQRVFFSAIEYEPLPLPKLSEQSVLLFTGIAKPQPLIEYLTPLCRKVQTIVFPDHHAFSQRDLAALNSAAEEADVVITTAKDFSRLSDNLPATLKSKLHVQNIGVKILFDQDTVLNQLITHAISNE